jgi:phosphocarrier protein
MSEGPNAALPRVVTIANRRGLHARAAARFVKVAASFDATVMVARNDVEVCGVSIMGLMMLAATPGTTIELRASGPQAAPALAALAALVANRFDED